MPAAAYPPPGHFLRHLHLTGDTTQPGVSIGTVPALADLCDSEGNLYLGAIAAALDLAAGSLAVQHVHPDWTATSHLSLQTSAAVRSGRATLTCSVLRAGRTSVFIAAQLTGEAGEVAGSATIGFQRLVRRDGNPDEAGAPPGKVTDLGAGEPVSGRPALPDFLGIRRLDAGAELDLGPLVGNSFGTLQGGVVASLLEAAALSTVSGAPARVADLEVHYLAAGKTGPFRATAQVVREGAGASVVRLELRDAGEKDRLLSTGVATILIRQS